MTPFWVVIPAAGQGSRLNPDIPKQFLSIAGKTILEHTLDRFLSLDGCQNIVLVVDERSLDIDSLVLPEKVTLLKVKSVSRAQSVLAGLQELERTIPTEALVLVHDAARPLLSSTDVRSLVQHLLLSGRAAILGKPVTDTLKRINGHAVTQTLDRTTLWRAQTPQGAPLSQLITAIADCLRDNLVITDESCALETMGYPVDMLQSTTCNTKLTTKDDLPYFEWALSETVL